MAVLRYWAVTETGCERKALWIGYYLWSCYVPRHVIGLDSADDIALSLHYYYQLFTLNF